MTGSELWQSPIFSHTNLVEVLRFIRLGPEARATIPAC